MARGVSGAGLVADQQLLPTSTDRHSGSPILGGRQFAHPEEMTRMIDKYPPAATPPQGRSAPSESLPPASAREHGTADVVKGEAADLGHGSVQAGKHVAEVAREQASGVVAEAGRQGRDLLQQAQEELEVQAAHGQQRLAKQLLSLSDELRSMTDASGRGGMAADLTQHAASRVRDAGQWLDEHRPGQVAEEMQSFARRRPAVFLALAAGAGLVAGRLTRGLKNAASDNSMAATAPVATAPPSGEPNLLVTDDEAGRQGTP
jgi:hypothetical protein